MNPDIAQINDSVDFPFSNPDKFTKMAKLSHISNREIGELEINVNQTSRTINNLRSVAPEKVHAFSEVFDSYKKMAKNSDQKKDIRKQALNQSTCRGKIEK